MKIREVAKEAPKVETPFVVGGVYRIDGGDYRLLVSDGNGKYATFAFNGQPGFIWQSRESIVGALKFYNAEYVPDAELVVPAK
jgi:hypothetical protein